MCSLMDMIQDVKVKRGAEGEALLLVAACLWLSSNHVTMMAVLGCRLIG